METQNQQQQQQQQQHNGTGDVRQKKHDTAAVKGGKRSGLGVILNNTLAISPSSILSDSNVKEVLLLIYNCVYVCPITFTK